MCKQNSKPQFRFDLRTLIQDTHRYLSNKIEGVTISLPFVSFTVKPDDIEKKAAREIVIRLADKRVLNAFECCDDCIDKALDSLQKTRSQLVDKQVELANHSNRILYLLIEFMTEAIRQFFTYEERLHKTAPANSYPSPVNTHSHRLPNTQQAYFASLEMLRAHLHRCLSQIATIANINIPKIPDNMRYDTTWQLEAYIEPDNS